MLDVLLLGNEANEEMLADFTPEYRRLDEEDLFGDVVTNTGFASRQGEQGAHLHWTLPDALLKGEQDEDGSMIFPEVPNRWLVIRLKESEQGTGIARKVWVIESDAITYTKFKTKEGIPKTSIPCLVYDDKEKIYRPAGKDGAYYAYLGDVREYGTERSEPAVYMDKLTAVGPGDHLFSGFYPLCRTVFGFYDSLSGEDTGDYTYLVCGYYEKDTSDPFGYMSAEETAQRFMWCWDKETEQPDSVLCHGAAYHVNWQGPDHCYVKSPDRFLDLVLGYTSAEALSCYLQNHITSGEESSTTEWERILNALQCGILEEYANNRQADADIELEDSLHGRQFEYAEAGDNWMLQAKGAAPSDSLTLMKEDQDPIREVMGTAEQLNRIRCLKVDYGKECYLYWHRYIRMLCSPFGPGQEEEDAAKEALEQALKAYEEKDADEKTYTDKLNKLLDEVNRNLSQSNLSLKRVPSRRFIRPNPPVLLMVEADTDRVRRQGEQKDDEGQLPCRMSTVGRLTVELPEGRMSIEAGELNRLWQDTLPDHAEALCAETVILSDVYAPALARMILDKAGIVCTDERLRDTVTRVTAAQESTAGRPFSIALRQWAMPWNAMMMEWQTEITPARTKDTDNTFDYFTLDDIDWEAKDIDFRGQPITVTGQTLLTPHAAVLMKERLEDLLQNYGEGKDRKVIEELIDKLGKRQIVSQQMTGFYEAFQGLKYVPALPVLPYVEREETKGLAARVARAVNGICPVTKPGTDPQDYLPLSGGLMELKKLRLIDTFGQYRDVALTKYGINVSESMWCGKEGTALLRPRFSGGMRINYNWLSARDNHAISLDSSSSPIFGFILENVYDQNLQIYDEGGVFLGWLQRTDRGIQWRSAPGTTFAPEDIGNRHLRQFVQEVLQWKNEQLIELINRMDAHFVQRTQMCRGQSPITLLGNVLALTRMRLSLEEEGLQAKFWGAEDVLTGDYDREEFYIMLGDERRSKDGVVGFCPDKGEQDDYGKVVYDHKVPMTLRDSERSFTLLFDPYREVTVRTGFLPTLRECLAPELYQAQVESMKPVISLWPVLSPEGELQLPMTKIGGWDLEATYIRQTGEAEVCGIQHSLTDLLTEERHEINEIYLTWKKEAK